MIRARYNNCSFWKCELKPSKHACKIFFNYSKLCAISFLAKKYNFYHQNTSLDAFRTNSRNIICRNPSLVIPLIANQDLTPMLSAGIHQNFRQLFVAYFWRMFTRYCQIYSFVLVSRFCYGQGTVRIPLLLKK